MDDRKTMLLEEWKDIRDSLRYFGNKRFAQLTVFIAATAFLIDTFIKQPGSGARWTLALFGIGVGLVFLIMEITSVILWKAFAARGVVIETETGVIELMRTARSRVEVALGFTNWTTYLVYGSVIVLWGFFFNTVKNVQDATTIVEIATKSAPVLSGRSTSTWSTSSLKWDESTGTYLVVLVETGSKSTLSVTLHGASGKVIGSQLVP